MEHKGDAIFRHDMKREVKYDVMQLTAKQNGWNERYVETRREKSFYFYISMSIFCFIFPTRNAEQLLCYRIRVFI